MIQILKNVYLMLVVILILIVHYIILKNYVYYVYKVIILIRLVKNVNQMDLNILKNQNVKIILMIKKTLVINVRQNIYK